MESGTEGQQASMERLSALVDGELDDHSVGYACAAWRDDVAARSSWHAYQLIGDVLRSEDLASNAKRDCAFVLAVRDRLAGEPTVLAPQPLASPQRLQAGGSPRKRSWMGLSAVAAGFMAVAAVLVVTQSPNPVLTAQPNANGTQGVAPAVVQQVAANTRAASAGPDAAFDAHSMVANGSVIRDARLDRYLAAHKQFAGSSALGVPSGFLRSATSDAANR